MVTKIKRNRGVVNRVIRNHLAKNKKLILHGARAQNQQLPRHLQRKSVDFDIFSPTPKKSALKLERVLDRRFRGDSFKTVEGLTKSLEVHKVKSNKTGESFADFSKPDRIIPTNAIRGKRFASLSDQKERALQNIKNPETQFRREKDLNFLKRVNKFSRKRKWI